MKRARQPAFKGGGGVGVITVGFLAPTERKGHRFFGLRKIIGAPRVTKHFIITNLANRARCRAFAAHVIKPIALIVAKLLGNGAVFKDVGRVFWRISVLVRIYQQRALRPCLFVKATPHLKRAARVKIVKARGKEYGDIRVIGRPSRFTAAKARFPERVVFVGVLQRLVKARDLFPEHCL